MNGMAQIIGGPVAYGIGYIDNALPAWKVRLPVSHSPPLPPTQPN